MALDRIRYLLDEKIMSTAYTKKTITFRVPNELLWNTNDVARFVEKEFERKQLVGDPYNIIEVLEVSKDKNYHDHKTTRYNVEIIMAFIPINFIE